MCSDIFYDNDIVNTYYNVLLTSSTAIAQDYEI